MTPLPSLTWAVSSDPGLKRTSNEDSYSTRADVGLFVVADGMGGHVAGEVASRVAVEAIEAFIEETAGADKNRTWPFPFDPTVSLESNRLRAACSGIYADGWSGANDSAYFHFTTVKQGWLRIRISRQNWAGSPVDVQFGSIRTEYKQPVLGRIFRDLRFTVRSGAPKVIWLRTPTEPFGARIVVANKFVPRELDPEHFSDPRELGALVDYRFFTKLPRGVTPQRTP